VTKGTLRVYLGAAPGVGKTYAMLSEGRRRHSRGTDVVVGLVETHGRALTASQIAELEVVPRTKVTYRDTEFEEMDVEAVIARRPEVVLVDELAHTNIPGLKHEKLVLEVPMVVHPRRASGSARMWSSLRGRSPVRSSASLHGRCGVRPGTW
jgi:two-component system sensor histidine kinase KdpD